MQQVVICSLVDHRQHIIVICSLVDYRQQMIVISSLVDYGQQMNVICSLVDYGQQLSTKLIGFRSEIGAAKVNHLKFLLQMQT